jgi:hypothetical protein
MSMDSMVRLRGSRAGSTQPDWLFSLVLTVDQPGADAGAIAGDAALALLDAGLEDLVWYVVAHSAGHEAIVEVGEAGP